MGFVEKLFKVAAETLVNDTAFTAGKEGKPPPVWKTPGMQEVADKAFRAGQEAAKVEVLNRVSDKLKD